MSSGWLNVSLFQADVLLRIHVNKILPQLDQVGLVILFSFLNIEEINAKNVKSNLEKNNNNSRT